MAAILNYSKYNLTYCIPKCVQFAAVILEINFQCLAYMCDAHTLVSCLMQKNFNSEHATADKSGLKV